MARSTEQKLVFKDEMTSFLAGMDHALASGDTEKRLPNKLVVKICDKILLNAMRKTLQDFVAKHALEPLQSGQQSVPCPSVSKASVWLWQFCVSFNLGGEGKQDRLTSNKY